MKVNLDALHPKHKVLLFSTLMLLLTLLFYLLVLHPQLLRISSLSNELQFEKQRVESIEAFVLAHPNSDEYLIELDRNAGVVDELLPNQLELSGFIEQLDQIAKNSGVQLKHIKPATVINKNSYREIPMEIIVQGSYIRTLSFFDKLESLPRYAMITNISTQSKKNILETKLTLVIYSFGVVQNQKPAEPAQK